MTEDEFTTSPAKRRRTMSPEVTEKPQILGESDSSSSVQPQSMPQPSPLSHDTSQKATDDVDERNKEDPALNEPSAGGVRGEEYGILDALMQHVESESRPRTFGQSNGEDTLGVQGEHAPALKLVDDNIPPMGSEVTFPQAVKEVRSETIEDIPMAETLDEPTTLVQKTGIEQSLQNGDTTGEDKPANIQAHGTETTYQPDSEFLPQVDIANASVDTEDELRPESTTEAGLISEDLAAEPGQAAEWEVDSSPLNSSSESDSSDLSSSDDSDEDADGDYAMLNPEELSRILMEGDGGSDDEGGKTKDKSNAAPLRTANEKPEEIIPKPDIIITPEMVIEELGKVEAVVENAVLVKAKISGEYQVLESGSLLCLKDRSVVGVVSETLGRVELPMYTIRFTNEKAIEEAGLKNPGAIIYYVPTHSTFVFTQPLRAVKGSDASNFHDEEVGDDEMEFSDDEAEAEHKRMMKMKKRGKGDDSGRGRGVRGGRGNFRGDRQFAPHGSHSGETDAPYRHGPVEINYDDAESLEDSYTPLQRPPNLQMVSQENFLERQSPEAHRGNDRHSRGRDRSRGGHRADRGSRGGRGRGRGNWDRSSNGSDRKQSYANDFSSSPTTHQPQSAPFTPSQMPPPQHHSCQYHQQQTPQQPVLPPQNQSHPTFPFSPPPVSPLPNQHFNFGGYGQPQPQFGTGQPHFQPPHSYHQQPGQLPGLPPPGSYVNTAFTQNFNQAAAAEVQKQLELMRQNGGR